MKIYVTYIIDLLFVLTLSSVDTNDSIGNNFAFNMKCPEGIKEMKTKTQMLGKKYERAKSIEKNE